VRVDEGPWQPATLDPVTAKDKFGWKLFHYTWNNPTAGAHTLVSRVTDATCKVQPTADDLKEEVVPQPPASFVRVQQWNRRSPR